MPKFAAQADFLGIPLKNVRVEQAASAPASPEEGRVYHDTGLKSLRTYLNGAWTSLDPANTSLTDLKNVLAAGAASGQFLKYNGTNWVNATIAINEVSGLQSALEGKAASSHNHDGSHLTSGTVNIARLPVAASGTSNTTSVVRADDARLSNARTPTGTAGGALSGSYPNPGLASGAVTDGNVAAANKDGAASTPSLRTLGPGAQQAMPGNATLQSLTVATGTPVHVEGNRVAGMADPIQADDAATKRYVDSMAQGLKTRTAVRLATNSNLTLNGTQTHQGVSLVAGDRVLVVAQTDLKLNGVYEVRASAAWVRVDTDATDGSFWFVQEGARRNQGWVLTTDGAITWGTTNITFEQFSGAGQIVAGIGLVKNGEELSVGKIGIANGGTGATTALEARNNLAATGRYTASVPALSAGVEVSVQYTSEAAVAEPASVVFTQASDGAQIYLDWRPDISGRVLVRADVAFASGALFMKVVV